MTTGIKTGGRKAGTPNRSTAYVREKIQDFANETVDDFIEWVREVGKESPKDGADLFLKALEYHIPKLQRTDAHHTGEQTSNLKTEIPCAPNSKGKTDEG